MVIRVLNAFHHVDVCGVDFFGEHGHLYHSFIEIDELCGILIFKHLNLFTQGVSIRSEVLFNLFEHSLHPFEPELIGFVLSVGLGEFEIYALNSCALLPPHALNRLLVRSIVAFESLKLLLSLLK